MCYDNHYGIQEVQKAEIFETEHEITHPEHQTDVYVDKFHFVHINCLDCDFGVVHPQF